jgi:predicted RNA-binding Zn ribbon-like protein
MVNLPERTTLFDLVGGHPALDLVNSLDNRYSADGPTERLTGGKELVRLLDETGVITAQQARLLDGPAEQALQSVRELREASAVVFYAIAEDRTPPARDLATLERYFLTANNQRHLHWENGAAWQWNADASNPELAVWILSQSVSELLFSDRIAQIRTCDVDTCRWLFLDTSKNHSRRWCNMRVCGNRVKARRFQARRGA